MDEINTDLTAAQHHAKAVRLLAAGSTAAKDAAGWNGERRSELTPPSAALVRFADAQTALTAALTHAVLALYSPSVEAAQ